MTARGGALDRALHHALESRAGARALVLGYLGVTAVFALSQRYLHDEGVFTLDQARLAWEAPGGLFFLLKAKPPLVALYALPAALGVDAFALAHAAVGALSVHFTIVAARRLELAMPNLAGWALAASAHVTIGVSNGYPNVDGAFFLALFLALYFAERRTAAAVLLGVLPFARHELAAVTVAFVGWDLARRRDARFVAAVLVWPALYGAAGALYHGDPLWLLHLFPDPSGLPRGLRVFERPAPLEALANLRAAIAANAPPLAVLGVAAFARPERRLTPLYVAALLAYGGMTALQVFGVLGFDTSPRYYLAPLPLVALLAASAAALPATERRTRYAAMAVAILSAAASLVASLSALAVVVASLLATERRRPRLAAGLLVVAALGALAAHLVREDGREQAQHRELTELLGAMRARGLYDGGPLYTDFVIARYDHDLEGAEVHRLANQAISWEARQNLREDFDRLTRAAGRVGIVVDAEAHAIRAGAVYTLSVDPRTEAWRARLEAAGAERHRLGRHWVYTVP